MSTTQVCTLKRLPPSEGTLQLVNHTPDNLYVVGYTYAKCDSDTIRDVNDTPLCLWPACRPVAMGSPYDALQLQHHPILLSYLNVCWQPVAAA